MNNVRDARSARAFAQKLLRSMEQVASLSKSNPGIVRVATDAGGDQVAFWNDGAMAREFNMSLALRQILDIGKDFPDALKTRSGVAISPLRIELPLSQ